MYLCVKWIFGILIDHLVQHGGVVVRNVLSQQKRLGFESAVVFLYGGLYVLPVSRLGLPRILQLPPTVRAGG